MAKLLVLAVYDEKAKTYGNPVFEANKGLAVRGFSEAVSAENSFLAKHAGDFKLYCLGEYDNENGKFKSYNVPEFVCHASDFIKVKNGGV